MCAAAAAVDAAAAMPPRQAAAAGAEPHAPRHAAPFELDRVRAATCLTRASLLGALGAVRTASGTAQLRRSIPPARAAELCYRNASRAQLVRPTAALASTGRWLYQRILCKALRATMRIATLQPVNTASRCSMPQSMRPARPPCAMQLATCSQHAPCMPYIAPRRNAQLTPLSLAAREMQRSRTCGFVPCCTLRDRGRWSTGALR
jgi:hypothetical protein